MRISLLALSFVLALAFRDPGYRRAYMIASALMVGTVGAVSGTVVGAFRRTDRWEALAPSEWGSRITVAPTSSRGIALRVTF